MAKFTATVNNGDSYVGTSTDFFIAGSLGVSSSGTFVEWTILFLNSFNNSLYPCTALTELNGNYTIDCDAPSGLDLGDSSLTYPVFIAFQPPSATPFYFSFQYVDDTTTPPADLTICTECVQSNQQACGETYFIEAGLTSGTTYYAAITDRNNDVYTQAIMADANGNLTIDALAPEFPVGFWLAESGNKSITVYEDEDMTIVSELTVGANVYTCMILTLQYMYTTTSGLIPDFAFYVSDTLDFYVDNSSNTYIA